MENTEMQATETNVSAGKKIVLFGTGVIASVVGYSASFADYTGSLVTAAQNTQFTDSTINGVTMVVATITGISGFLIVKYFGKRIIGFLEKVLMH